MSEKMCETCTNWNGTACEPDIPLFCPRWARRSPSPSVDEVRVDLMRLLDAVVWTGCPCGKPHIAKSLVENKGTIIGLYKKYRGA